MPKQTKDPMQIVKNGVIYTFGRSSIEVDFIAPVDTTEEDFPFNRIVDETTN